MNPKWEVTRYMRSYLGHNIYLHKVSGMKQWQVTIVSRRESKVLNNPIILKELTTPEAAARMAIKHIKQLKERK